MANQCQIKKEKKAHEKWLFLYGFVLIAVVPLQVELTHVFWKNKPILILEASFVWGLSLADRTAHALSQVSYWLFNSSPTDREKNGVRIVLKLNYKF